MSSVQAVIFDMDGVLIDSGPPHHVSWQIVAKRAGMNVSAERFASTFGRPSRDIIRIIWGEGIAAAAIERIGAEKEAAYRELVRDQVPIMPGCREALARLRQAGLRMAVATSGPPENLDLTLDGGGIRPFFDVTVHGFDIQHGKPAPDCFLLAAERLGISPAACVVIEDAVVGVQAAVAAGMRVIGFAPNGDGDRLRGAGAIAVIAAMSVLDQALRSARPLGQ